MQNLAVEVIASRIRADLRDEKDEGLVAGIIADKLPARANLASIEAAIERAKIEFGVLFKAAAATAKAPAADSPQAAAAAKAKARDAKRLDAALAMGNPWAIGSVTTQVLVESLDPARAARLKAEAGRA